MKYIISQEELRILAGKIQFGYAESDIRNFLKDKEPVEMVAEGVVDVFKYNTLVGKLSMGPEKCEFVEKINAYSGKKIQIFIKEVK